MSVQALVSFVTLLIGLGCTSLAKASYDRSCEDLLARSGAVRSEFEMTNVQGQLAKLVGLDHEMSAIEFVAIKDLLAGLSLKLIFRSATPHLVSDATPATLKAFGHALNRSDLIEVVYRPSTLRKVGEVLWRVCLVMNLDRCETYRQFKGFADPSWRPLSPIEEQGIKWVTFTNLAPPTFDSMYDEAVKHLGRARAYMLATDMARRAEFNVLFARDFIRPERSILGVQSVVVPMIADSWQKALGKVRAKLD